MNWTSNPPFKEGFYWSFHNAIGTCKLLDVFLSNDAYFAGDIIMREHNPVPVAEFKDVQWFGPIEPPDIPHSRILASMGFERIGSCMFILKDKSPQ